MKKNYFFGLLLIFFSVIASAQVSLPHYESFDYTVGAGLGDQTNWEDFNGSSNPIDVVSGSLSYSGFANSTGNSINLVGGFIDSRVLFNEVTSGVVYASFLVKVTDISNIVDLTDGGYFALFGSTTNSFSSRLWVRPATNPVGSTIDFAYNNSSSTPTAEFGDDFNVNDVLLIVVSYNVDTGVVNSWINPNSSTFEAGSAPAPDLTGTDSSPNSIDRFMLRQDSTGETPNMIIDELRIGTTWASVTPSGAVSTTPSVTINSPSNNQIFPANTTQVPINLNIQNFTVSGDAGGGVSDNTGDGYLKATLEETGQATEVRNFFTATPDPITVVAGRTYTAKVELVDNSGNSLTPKAEASVTFSVTLPCNLQLTTITKTCDATTSGTDTYQASIDFSDGNTGTTYTITAKDTNDNNVGTITGDNPSTSASGKITITGIPEGTNIIVKVVGDSGSSCDFTRNISSPICYPLPILETFSYTENQSLISNPLWKDASVSNPANDIQVIKNDDGGGNPILGNYYTSAQLPDPIGNFVRLDGKGSDPYIGFEGKTTGIVYTSFLMSITNMDDFKTNANGGYFAVLAESNTSFRARVWVKDPTAGGANEGLTFNVGVSIGSTSTMHTGFTANLAEPVFVVVSYNLDTDEVKLWTVPDAATFGTNTPPSANITLTGGSADEINRFILRQDSDSETPTINFDELRIGTSWKDVTTNPTASVKNSAIDGFALYPNPVTGNRFTVKSASTDSKEVIIFNVLGKKVFASNFSGTKKDIDVSALNSGVYILKVKESGKIATKKLIIR